MYSSNPDGGFAMGIPSELQEHGEVDDLVPGRFSEVFPRPFQLYYDRWIKYWPKNAVHVKRAYDGGFIQRKKKDGRSLNLFPALAVEWAERHLNPHQWAAWKEYEEPGRDVDDGPFWLGLHVPKKATVDAIDLDAKRYLLAYYRRREDEPSANSRPGPGAFPTLKPSTTASPAVSGRFSSATLGVHAWRRRRRPADTEATHAEVKARLGEIGLGHVEVHPMKGRCLRRPFGTDYKTITPEGVLDDWDSAGGVLRARRSHSDLRAGRPVRRRRGAAAGRGVQEHPLSGKSEFQAGDRRADRPEEP